MEYAPVSIAHAALKCRCPRCGEGPVFTGLLTVREACPRCGLDLSAEDAGDGPAVFLIFLLGVSAIVTALQYLPALVLGPVAEHLLGAQGATF